jgi:peptide deformylase
MTVRALLQLPNAKDVVTRKKLAQPSALVVDFGPTTQSLIRDLEDTMMAHPVAVGLAAPQIGEFFRVAVVNLKNNPAKETLILINPVLVDSSGKKDTKKESCMSVPGVRGPVVRRDKAHVRYQAADGSPKEIRADGFLARAIMHEIDHLDGLLYLDRIEKGELEKVEFIR